MEWPLADGVERGRIHAGELGAFRIEDGFEAGDEAGDVRQGGLLSVGEAERAFGGARDQAFVSDNGFPERFRREGAGQDAALTNNGNRLEEGHSPLH